MAITKLELANHLHKKMGLPKKDCLDFVNSFFTEISNSLAKGEEVKLSGFGNFSLLKKKAKYLAGRSCLDNQRLRLGPTRVGIFTNESFPFFWDRKKKMTRWHCLNIYDCITIGLVRMIIVGRILVGVSARLSCIATAPLIFLMLWALAHILAPCGDGF